MVKLFEAHYFCDFQIDVVFLDGKENSFDGKILLQRPGSLLEPLRDKNYFQRLFIDAGALCWPNGLELATAHIYETCGTLETV